MFREFFDLLQFLSHVFGKHSLPDLGDVGRNGLSEFGEFVCLLLQLGEIERTFGRNGRREIPFSFCRGLSCLYFAGRDGCGPWLLRRSGRCHQQ